MKIVKRFSFAIWLVLLASFVACSDDEFPHDQKATLYGKYIRSDSDSKNNFELHLTEGSELFNGILFHYFGSCFLDEQEGEVCLLGASSESFFWNIKNNTFILEYDNEVVKVAYTLDEEGNLHLSVPNWLTDFKDCYFVRVHDEQ